MAAPRAEECFWHLSGETEYRFVAAERRPSSLEVVTLDGRLADAARKEGFELIDVMAD